MLGNVQEIGLHVRFLEKMPLAKHVVTQLLIQPTFPSTEWPVSQWYSTAFPNSIGEVSSRVECSTAGVSPHTYTSQVSPCSPAPILYSVGQEQLKPLIWLLHVPEEQDPLPFHSAHSLISSHFSPLLMETESNPALQSQVKIQVSIGTYTVVSTWMC